MWRRRVSAFAGVFALTFASPAFAEDPPPPPPCGPVGPVPPCCGPVAPVPAHPMPEPKPGVPALGILPEHCKCVAHERPCAMRKVCRPQFETCKVPRYALELVETFLTIDKPILKPGLGPLLVPMTVPDVREYDVPIYETMEVPLDCRCPQKTVPQRVVARTEKRRQFCGQKIVFVEVPGKTAPQVVVRFETQRIPLGKRLQWVRKDDVETKRFIGDAIVEEPVPGPPIPPTIKDVCVPCEAVTVIADEPTPEAVRSAREATRPLPGTTRVLTLAEFKERLRAIQTSPIAADSPAAAGPTRNVRR